MEKSKGITKISPDELKTTNNETNEVTVKRVQIDSVKKATLISYLFSN